VPARSQIQLSSICEHYLEHHIIDRGVALPTGDNNILKNIKCEPMTTQSEAEFCERAFLHLISLNPKRVKFVRLYHKKEVMFINKNRASWIDG